jgi:peptidyl-prolyl cis-trans isomerase A (cyclophilin A)
MKSLLLALGSAALIANSAAFAQKAPPAAHPVVLIKTTDGDIRVVLDPDKAPKTVDNFLKYVKSDQYKDTIFHRVIRGFMIQGGGYTKGYAEKPTGAPIDLERSGLKNTKGTIAMARTSNPNSATAQFFINTVDNPRLDASNPDDQGYTVFGEVISGMDVVQKIEGTPTTTRGRMENVPQTPVVIKSISIVPK